MDTGIHCEVVTDWRSILSLCEEWNVLLTHSRCNRAFNSSQWYSAVPLILPELSPFLCIARRAGTVQGILPLWLDQRQQKVEFAGHFCDHLDIIAADDDLEVMTGLLAFALQEASRYGGLSLRRIKPDSNCVRAARALGFCRQIEEGFAAGTAREYAVIDLSLGYDRYLKSLSRKFRLTLNRMRNKAERDGIVTRELHLHDFVPKRLPEAFLSLHSARFGGKSRLLSQSASAWVHHLLPSLFAGQSLRAFALFVGDQIAGIDLAMVGSSGLYAWTGGFLPEVEQYDPGKLLIDKTIQLCSVERLMEYDIGWFQQQYKAHWKPNIRRIGNLQFDGCEYQSSNAIAVGNQSV